MFNGKVQLCRMLLVGNEQRCRQRHEPVNKSYLSYSIIPAIVFTLHS